MIESFSEMALEVEALDGGVSKGHGHHRSRSEVPKQGKNKSVGGVQGGHSIPAFGQRRKGESYGGDDGQEEVLGMGEMGDVVPSSLQIIR